MSNMRKKLLSHLEQIAASNGITVRELGNISRDNPDIGKVCATIREANLKSKMFSIRTISELIGVGEHQLEKTLSYVSHLQYRGQLEKKMEAKVAASRLRTYILQKKTFTIYDIEETFQDEYMDWWDIAMSVIGKLKRERRLTYKGHRFKNKIYYVK